MSDIAFSMTADERDVIRGLQNVGKEQGKLREQISQLVSASKAAGAADSQLAQQRLAALNPILEKQKELKQSFSDIESQLKSGKISQEQYNASFKDLSKESNKLQTSLNQLSAEVKQDAADMQRAGNIIGQTETATQKYARSVAELNRLKEKGILSTEQHAQAMTAEDAKLKELTRDLEAEAKAAAQVARAEAETAKTLRDVGTAYGRVSDQVQELSSIAKAAGVSDVQISKQRLAALAPIAEKQEEIRREAQQLKAQLAAGTISADEYAAATQRLNTKSTDLATSLNKLQTELKEDAADIRKAGTAMQGAETATDRYKRKVMELDQQKAKGIITSQQHAKAVAAEGEKIDAAGKSAGSGGDMFAALGTKVAAAAAGFVSMSAVIATLKNEYDALLERQGKSKDANISLATEQEALLMNLGGADPKQTTDQIRELSKKSGVKEENITRAVNEAMAARGDMDAQSVIDAVGSVSKIRKFAPSEMAGLAAATIDTQKQTGLGTDESLGFLLQMQEQSRTKNLKGLAENFTPAVGGIMNFGADRQTAGAMLSSLSHGMGDTSGAMTATSGIQLAKQLREFGQQQNPEFLKEQQTLSASQAEEKSALEADFDKQAIEVRSKKFATPALKAESLRQLDEEKQTKTSQMKERHASESEKLTNSAPAVSIGDTLARLQQDEDLRKKFLASASFEAKALPAVESLLSGGKQAEQFASAKEALSADPTETLQNAIKARGSSVSIGLAEKDMALANITDQQKLADTSGAESSIARDRLKELRDQTGRMKISSSLQGIVEDVATGGKQTTEGSLNTMEAEIALLKQGSTDSTRALRATGMTGALAATYQEKQNREDPETQKLVKNLEELVALTRQQLAGQAEANANNAAKAHAGIVKNRAGEQQ